MDTSKDLARALRRHHAERLKAARSDYWGRTYAAQDPLTPRQKGILLGTPAVCSCWMCGNPRRKHGERSFQEVREFQVNALDLLDQGRVSDES